MPAYLGESQIRCHSWTDPASQLQPASELPPSVCPVVVRCSVGVVDSIDRADCMQLVPTVAFAELINRFPLVPHIVIVASAASRVKCVTQWRQI